MKSLGRSTIRQWRSYRGIQAVQWTGIPDFQRASSDKENTRPTKFMKRCVDGGIAICRIVNHAFPAGRLHSA